MAYCLPKEYASKFMVALRDGTINPGKLIDMSSTERREFFAPIVGEKHAKEVNALFESKLLLKNQQAGLVNWAKHLAGITEPARQEVMHKIAKLDRVLQPEDERTFLADLAEQKLGVSVTPQEAKAIYDLSKVAQQAEARMLGDGWNMENGTAYGEAKLALIDKIESLKPERERSLLTRVEDVANIPRSIMSTGDFSALFQQGWGSMTTPEFWQAIPKMFKYFANEGAFQRQRAQIVGHKYYPLMIKSKLALTDLGDKLTKREEEIQSSMLERYSQRVADRFGTVNPIRATNRAFTGFLNEVRYRSFVNLVDAAKAAGEDVSAGSSAVKDLADVVNNFTGRGSLTVKVAGKEYEFEGAAPFLNAFFFSPRKMAAMFHMFNPVNMVNSRISMTARKAATRRLLGSLAATASVIELSNLLGFQVQWNPLHQDFAKIQIGNTKFDISGGNATYLRLLMRIARQKTVDKYGMTHEFGTKYNSPNTATELGYFVRGKLSPWAASITDAAYGKDPVGRPFSVTEEMRDKLTPMSISNIIDVATEDPGNNLGLLLSPASVFGINVQPPTPEIEGRVRKVWDVWGQPIGQKSYNDPVDKVLDQLDLEITFPSSKVSGVQLTDKQYADYSRISGRKARMDLSALIKTPYFNGANPELQKKLIRHTMAVARDAARRALIVSHDNSNIIRDAAAAKRALYARPGQAAAQ